MRNLTNSLLNIINFSFRRGPGSDIGSEDLRRGAEAAEEFAASGRVMAGNRTMILMELFLKHPEAMYNLYRKKVDSSGFAPPEGSPAEDAFRKTFIVDAMAAHEAIKAGERPPVGREVRDLLEFMDDFPFVAEVFFNNEVDRIGVSTGLDRRIQAKAKRSQVRDLREAVRLHRLASRGRALVMSDDYAHRRPRVVKLLKALHAHPVLIDLHSAIIGKIARSRRPKVMFFLVNVVKNMDEEGLWRSFSASAAPLREGLLERVLSIAGTPRYTLGIFENLGLRALVRHPLAMGRILGAGVVGLKASAEYDRIEEAWDSASLMKQRRTFVIDKQNAPAFRLIAKNPTCLYNMYEKTLIIEPRSLRPHK